ncbi:MAG: hypothetical protein KDC66_22670 [Phaeodactylibacter sp.]|nr:hypothetical protein [Phaeodactylibacter sp.]
MNAKILLATLAGTVAFFIMGFLSFVLMEDVFVANLGSATGVMKDPPAYWALILGNVLLSALIAIIFGYWAQIKTFSGGLRAGALIGLLMTGGFDLLYYGSTNVMKLNGVVIDIVSYVIITAIVGGVVAWVLGRDSK